MLMFTLHNVTDYTIEEILELHKSPNVIIFCDGDEHTTFMVRFDEEDWSTPHGQIVSTY